MTCPVCNSGRTSTTDSRKTGHGIRRRRQCLDCGLRFSTMEIEMENYLQLQRIMESETENNSQLQQIMEREMENYRQLQQIVKGNQKGGACHE